MIRMLQMLQKSREMTRMQSLWVAPLVAPAQHALQPWLIRVPATLQHAIVSAHAARLG